MKKFKLVLLVSVMAASFSAMAFTKDQSAADIKSEVLSRSATESLDAILKDAKAKGLPVSALTDALVKKDQDGAALLKALVAAGYDESATKTALINSGAETTSVLNATAAGGAGNQGGAGQTGGSGGFAGSNGSTFNGGGSGGGSRS